MSAGATGWLEKKSGGKDGKAKAKVLEKWDRRWFVLPAGGTELSYYKSDKAGATAAGSIDCAGAHVFLKEVKGQTFRFTVRASTRELKLRAPTAAAYQKWVDALTPIAAKVGDEDDMSVRPSTMSSFSVRPELTAGVSSAKVAAAAAATPPPKPSAPAAARDTPAALAALHDAPPSRSPPVAAEGAARRADAAGAAAAAAGEDGLRRVVVGQSVGVVVGGESSGGSAGGARADGGLAREEERREGGEGEGEGDGEVEQAVRE